MSGAEPSPHTTAARAPASRSRQSGAALTHERSRGHGRDAPRPSRDEHVSLELSSVPPATVVFRSLAFLAVAAITGWLLFAQSAIWGSGTSPSYFSDGVLSWGRALWLISIFPAFCGLMGLLCYRRPRIASGNLEPIDTRISFRIVSRGQNVDALKATIRNVRDEMARHPLFPYVMEVITDLQVPLAEGDDLVQLVVPPAYQTSQGARFKARALQYAIDASTLSDDAWLMHLDEESHITPALVAGIREAVAEEEATGQLRIGQGAILYYRSLRRKPLLALADSIRTGDDLGRFYLQQRMGITVFGLHGSFILVRNGVEKSVGFDFGPEGSITEDTFWALRQMEDGRRSRWVDGYLVEQAPGSLIDFVKQRRRWFVGLFKVVRHAPVSYRYRIGLAASLVIWAVSWLGLASAYASMAAGLAAPLWIRVVGDTALATFVALYVLGLKLNLDEHEPVGMARALLLYVAQVVLIPIFCVLEAAGVVYGIVKPERGFHVICKEHNS